MIHLENFLNVFFFLKQYEQLEKITWGLKQHKNFFKQIETTIKDLKQLENLWRLETFYTTWESRGQSKLIFQLVFEKFVFLFSVVSQDYVTESDNEYIILGNDALMKCEVPSFVSDLVQVHSWIDNENNEFYLKDGFRSKRGGRGLPFYFYFKKSWQKDTQVAVDINPKEIWQIDCSFLYFKRVKCKNVFSMKLSNE